MLLCRMESSSTMLAARTENRLCVKLEKSKILNPDTIVMFSLFINLI